MATFPNVNDMNVQFPNRYRMKAPDDVGEGEVVDLVPEYGSVIDPGTPLDSTLFDGIKEYVDDTVDALHPLDAHTFGGQVPRDFMRYQPGNHPGSPITGFDANTVERSRPSLIPIYNGVNVPSQTIAVLETVPYSGDWVVQYFHEITAGGGRLFRRAFHSGTTWSAWKDYAEKSSLLNMLYPVGSIYTTTSSAATCPIQSALGGTWVNYGGGRVLAGLDTTQTEFDSIGKTGGAKTHALTTAQMPKHSHPVIMTGGRAAAGAGHYTVTAAEGWAEGGALPVVQVKTTDTGGGAAHNNLQPYIVVRHWRRTA